MPTTTANAPAGGDFFISTPVSIFTVEQFQGDDALMIQTAEQFMRGATDALRGQDLDGAAQAQNDALEQLQQGLQQMSQALRQQFQSLFQAIHPFQLECDSRPCQAHFLLDQTGVQWIVFNVKYPDRRVHPVS